MALFYGSTYNSLFALFRITSFVLRQPTQFISIEAVYWILKTLFKYGDFDGEWKGAEGAERRVSRTLLCQACGGKGRRSRSRGAL